VRIDPRQGRTKTSDPSVASDTASGQDACARDEDIVERVRGGETGLFEVLVRRYNQRLFRVARAVLRDDTEAEDVMQQAYVNAYAHLAQFSGRARFSTWLTRIAVHEALARVRRRGRFGNDGGREPERTARDGKPDPEQQAHSAELRRLLDSAIDELPDAYRAAFVLREAEELETSEVAECLEISEEAVRTRVHRARARLRRSLFERTGALNASAFLFEAPRCDRVTAFVLRRIGGDAGAVPGGPATARRE
jgi:RNA polymerase sigma-70 factor (ECF subfamily)